VKLDKQGETTMTQDAHEGEVSNDDGSQPAVAAKIERTVLLAHVAGSVASGIVVSPSKALTTAASIAEIAVDIADEILKKAGL
jgi:hypothetical protein